MSERLKSFFRKAKEALDYRQTTRKTVVAADLRILIANEDQRYQDIAARIGISPASLSRQLSGKANLTLESIGNICDALGKDFDIVFRDAASRRALQSWEKAAYEADIIRMHCQAHSDAKEAQAILDTVITLSRRTWRRPPEIDTPMEHTRYTLSTNHETLAPAA